MLVLSGKKVAEVLGEEISQEVKDMISSEGVQPGLAVIIVGDDPASQVYVKNKGLACERVGMKSWIYPMKATSSKDELKAKIDSLNKNSEVHGILVQLPLPKGFSEDQVLSWIDPKKDVDSLTVENLGLFWSGRPRVLPCTPSGVMEILKHYDIGVEGKKAVVVGRSAIVGKPMALMLQNANATVTVCHSRTLDLSSYLREADIVVVAAGKPRFLGKEDFKKGSVVIDVGIHRVPNKGGEGTHLCGDVRFDELDDHVYGATPVPKGVGPMTIIMLLKNTLELAKQNSQA